jgi:hypothetical protein
MRRKESRAFRQTLEKSASALLRRASLGLSPCEETFLEAYPESLY